MPRVLPDFKASPLQSRRLPDWLKRDLSPGHEAARTDAIIKELGLHTICESGRCPNRNDCYSQKTATFMVMGDLCTRSCRFCSVSSGRPSELDRDEPQRLAEAVKHLGLSHVVITSVNRDDLEDEGAGHFVNVIEAVKMATPGIIIEVLTPDFKRTQRLAVKKIIDACPHIFNHNVETVPRLYPHVRSQAIYETSLEIFREIRKNSSSTWTKSGLMLGMGEEREEVIQVMADLNEAGCQMLTLGQYLQSSGSGVKVERYLEPAEFTDLKRAALAMGFQWVESGPMVRSSYHARDSFASLQALIQ